MTYESLFATPPRKLSLKQINKMRFRTRLLWAGVVVFFIVSLLKWQPTGAKAWLGAAGVAAFISAMAVVRVRRSEFLQEQMLDYLKNGVLVQGEMAERLPTYSRSRFGQARFIWKWNAKDYQVISPLASGFRDTRAGARVHLLVMPEKPERSLLLEPGQERYFEKMYFS